MNNSNNIAHYYCYLPGGACFPRQAFESFFSMAKRGWARRASSILGKLIKFSCSARVHNKKSCAQLGKNFRETQKSWKPFEKLIPIWEFEVAATSFVVGVEKAFPKGFSRFSRLGTAKRRSRLARRMPAFVSYHPQAGLEHRMNAFLFLNQIEETKISWAGRNFSGFNEIFSEKLAAAISIARLGPLSKARKKNSMYHGNDLLRSEPKKILPPLFVCGNDKSVSLPHIAGENKFFPRWRDIKVVGVAKNNEIKRPLSSIYDHPDSIARGNSLATETADNKFAVAFRHHSTMEGCQAVANRISQPMTWPLFCCSPCCCKCNRFRSGEPVEYTRKAAVKKFPGKISVSSHLKQKTFGMSWAVLVNEFVVGSSPPTLRR